jgi:hypothetical protein
MATASGSASTRQGVLHLFVLCAFAIAQPVFDLLGRYATFFVAHQAQPRDIALFVVALCIVPPATLAAVELAVAAVSARARRALHVLLVALLLALTLLPPLHRAVALAPPLAFGIAGLVGALGAAAYWRIAVARMFVSALAPAVVAFPLWFLFASPVAELLRSAPGMNAAAEIPSDAAPVVMVVFDELSMYALMNAAGQIDADRYPNFAALARTSTWYRNATTVADYTTIAVPAILTGSVPEHSRLPTAREHPHNLFTLLGAGYELRVVEPVTELCPRELCRRAGAAAEGGAFGALIGDALLVYLHMLAPAALRAGLPDIQRQWTFQFTAWNHDRIVGATRLDRAALFARFVDGIRPGRRPTLDFLHSLLPHFPYVYLTSGAVYDPPPFMFGRRPFNWFAPAEELDEVAWNADDREGPRVEQLRYLHQLAYVDTLIGRLLDHLRRTGQFDRTLLVVTADHGVCFRPGQSARYVNDGNHVDIMAVPLFIKAPGQQTGRIDDRNVETVDILPTIAEILGIAVPWPLAGQGMANPVTPGRDSKTIVTPSSRSNQLDLKRLVFPSRPADEPPLGLRNQLALFGTGPLDGRAPTPALANLLDRPVASLPRTDEPAPFRAVLLKPERYAQVKPASGAIPAFVRGSVESATPIAPHTIAAIAVNGVVRAITEILFDGHPPTPVFGALVPESVWRPGANSVEVYAVVPSGDGFALAPAAYD